MNYGKTFTIFSIAMLFSLSLKGKSFYTFGYVRESANSKSSLVPLFDKGAAMISVSHAKRLERQDYGPLSDGAWPAACWDFYNNTHCWPYKVGISTYKTGCLNHPGGLFDCTSNEADWDKVGYKGQSYKCQ